MTLPLGSRAREGWVRIPFPVPALITLTTLGDMSIGSPARAGFVSGLGCRGPLHFARQEHTRVVFTVDHETAGEATRTQEAAEVCVGTADGLVTGEPDAVLGITVADCVPVFVCDCRSGAFGILHSGWRGTGILRDAVHLMRERYGTDPADVVVTLGPSISGRSYIVDPERAAQFASEFGAECVGERDGQWHIDLRTANERIAIDLGIDVVNVVEQCTAENGLLGSYRRQGPESFTRMLALVGNIDP